MSRQGNNPQKIRESATTPPSEITVAALTYIPEQAGYFTNVLDALKLCLASIRAHADYPFDLLVLDNGSCKEVRSFLYEELEQGRIDYLIVNQRNIGKMNAVFQMLSAAPGETIFYTDGDIYYKPGWMSAHLNILKTFPKAGLVGGTPLRNLAQYCTEGTIGWIESHSSELEYQKGDLIPIEWTREFLHSVGSEDVERWKHLQDCRVTYKGVTAYAGASHMQYAISRAVAQSIPRYRSDKAISAENDLHIDTFLENSGYLRLSTDKSYVYHIGNSISESWLMYEYRRLVQERPSLQNVAAPRRRHWFWGRSKVRRVLMALYEWAFDLHYRNS